MLPFKRAVKKLVDLFKYEFSRISGAHRSIPDANFYRPLFSPWRGYGDFKSYYEIARPFTVVSPDRCYVLYSLALQAVNLDGHWYECGVYEGGSAMLLAKLLDAKKRHKQTRLHLFDTFEGMPETDPQKDLHKKGDFADTSLEAVKGRVSSLISDPNLVKFYKGFMPDTFKDLSSHSISFAHIDVDIYQSVLDCCNFIYPRLQNGGFMIFDDYGFPSCPGARRAVDEFFPDKHEIPLILPTGQAVVFRVRHDL